MIVLVGQETYHTSRQELQDCFPLEPIWTCEPACFVSITSNY